MKRSCNVKENNSTVKKHSWLPFTWWEVNEGHTLMAEPLNLLELLAAPQRNTTLVEGGQIGAFRRPAHVRLGPALHWDTKDVISRTSKPQRVNYINMTLRFSVISDLRLSLLIWLGPWHRYWKWPSSLQLHRSHCTGHDSRSPRSSGAYFPEQADTQSQWSQQDFRCFLMSILR